MCTELREKRKKTLFTAGLALKTVLYERTVKMKMDAVSDKEQYKITKN